MSTSTVLVRYSYSGWVDHKIGNGNCMELSYLNSFFPSAHPFEIRYSDQSVHPVLTTCMRYRTVPACLPTHFEWNETKQTRCKTRHTQNNNNHNRKKDKSVHVHIHLCFRRPIGYFGFFLFVFLDSTRFPDEAGGASVSQTRANTTCRDYNGWKEKGKQDNE